MQNHSGFSTQRDLIHSCSNLEGTDQQGEGIEAEEERQIPLPHLQSKTLTGE